MRWLQVTALVFPTIKRKLDNWTTEMEKSYYLKVSNNQKRKHFQPDYDANDAFVDVASCWYCFSSAFFHCLSATRRVGRPSQYSWLRVPGSHQSAQHQGLILRLGKGQQQQRVEIREDAGDGGPLPLVQDNGIEEPDEVLGQPLHGGVHGVKKLGGLLPAHTDDQLVKVHLRGLL